MPLSAEQRKIASAFPEIRWAMADRICIFRPDEVLTRKLAARLIAWLGEIETDSLHPFNRFTDLTKLRAIELSKLDLQNVAYWRRSTYKGPPVKSALLACSNESLELANAYRSFMAGSPIMVLVFQSLEEAAYWLGASAASLSEANSSR